MRLIGQKPALRRVGARARKCLAPGVELLEHRTLMTVVGFDDLVATGSGNIKTVYVPNVYDGIHWVNGYGGWDAIDYPNSHGAPMPHSPPNQVYPLVPPWANGDDSFSFVDSNETFEGAWFSGLSGAAPVTFKLYDNGVLVHTSASVTPGRTPTWLASGYTGPVDTVVVSSPNQGYLMDDVTYGRPVEINDTPDTNDNITLYNAATSTQAAVAQTIPAMVTNVYNTQQSFQLSVSPPGAATLSTNSVALAAGASTEVTITPQADSSKPNAVHIIVKKGGTAIGEDDMTIVSVTFPRDIRNSDTPVGMNDRIPSRVDTLVAVALNPSLTGSGQSVTMAFGRTSADNGGLTINGGATQDITASGFIDLQGTSQTVPGNAGGLHLVARVHGEDALQSAGFSVSAIPVLYRQIGYSLLPGGVLHFDYAWVSDSGDLADLDQVWVGEYVTYPNRGIVAGPGKPWRGNFPQPTIMPARVPGDGVNGHGEDTHSPPGFLLPTAGPAASFTATQYYGFHDFRSSNSPVSNTLGWQINLDGPIAITRSVVNAGTRSRPRWEYLITKSGVTNEAPLGTTQRPQRGRVNVDARRNTITDGFGTDRTIGAGIVRSDQISNSRFLGLAFLRGECTSRGASRFRRPRPG